MPRYIIKLTDKEKNDWYLEWSTIVDAPITCGESLEEFKDYYQRKYGQEGMRELPERMERVEAKGTSEINAFDVDETIRGNRAGNKEEELTKEQIIEKYCLDHQN